MNEEDIAVGFLDLFDEVKDILAAFLDNFIHLAVIVDDDSVIHLQLGQSYATKCGS